MCLSPLYNRRISLSLSGLDCLSSIFIYSPAYTFVKNAQIEGSIRLCVVVVCVLGRIESFEGFFKWFWWVSFSFLRKIKLNSGRKNDRQYKSSSSGKGKRKGDNSRILCCVSTQSYIYISLNLLSESKIRVMTSRCWGSCYRNSSTVLLHVLPNGRKKSKHC